MNTETTFVIGIVCKTCSTILPPHTMEEHLDKNHPIHQCPSHEICDDDWEYDDKGVKCRYDEEEGWIPIEDHCVECGYVDCECERGVVVPESEEDLIPLCDEDGYDTKCYFCNSRYCDAWLKIGNEKHPIHQDCF
jgi:hypothetical protein